MGIKIKGLLKKVSANVLAVCAITVTMVSANQVCVFIFHQPPVPEEMKKLRKF